MKLSVILSIPKTIIFNLRHLPIKQAVKLPVWVHYRTQVNVKGRIELPKVVKPFMIRIGFHTCEECNYYDETRLSISTGGVLRFDGTAHIGRGSKIVVASDGEMILGDNVAISASSTIVSYKKIVFGRDIQFSWDCLVMDSDTHNIYNEAGLISNPAREIRFGDKVWICNGCMILKGTEIPSNSVIGAHSVVSGKHFEENSIIAGSPAKTIKKIKSWSL
mgnify:CR=1 FL=1